VRSSKAPTTPNASFRDVVFRPKSSKRVPGRKAGMVVSAVLPEEVAVDVVELLLLLLLLLLAVALIEGALVFEF
jgi:hypothetical protein